MPDHQLPTKEELEKLPWPAIVAFAARCARRVQPLFIRAAKKEHLDPKHAEGMDNAMTLAEAMAANPADASDIIDAFVAQGHADIADAYTTGRDTDADDAYAAAAYAAAAADLHADAAAAAHAARAAAAAADHTSVYADPKVAAIWAMRRDFELLLAVCKPKDKGGLGWDASTPVPPGFFGPFWTDGVPEDWPVEQDERTEPLAIKIEFHVPVGLKGKDSRDFNESVVRVFLAMDELHRSMGGNGLRILDSASQQPAPMEDNTPLRQDEDKPVVTAGAC